jgi:hypothetical protein
MELIGPNTPGISCIYKSIKCLDIPIYICVKFVNACLICSQRPTIIVELLRDVFFKEANRLGKAARSTELD